MESAGPVTCPEGEESDVILRNGQTQTGPARSRPPGTSHALTHCAAERAGVCQSFGMAEVVLHTRVERRGPAGALLLTDAQVSDLGSGKRAPVVVTIGDRSARLRLAVMGGET